jgi:3-deoxy-D-manno-octulosonic-acid transferase
MARGLYTLLLWLLLPWLPIRLWWRGRKEPGYREHVGERFGRYAAASRSAGPLIWLHAVSLGETRACVPLVERLLAERKDSRILLTHMTATGRDAGCTLFGDTVQQAWLPYDYPFAMKAFLAHFRPTAGLLMETEVWPNLVAQCARTRVPLFLVNARLSRRSAEGYARLPGLTRPMFAALTGVAAQSAADATRLAAAGARDVVVTGNLKFDVAITEDARVLGRELRGRFGETRPVWIAACTRDGEESLLLDAMQSAHLPPGTLTVIVPRHPQRFAAVGELLRVRGIPFAARSTNVAVPADIGVVLGDSLGELPAYYVAADVAFVGGSLLPLGGHNLIEPIAVGTPTIVGPHVFNFAEAARTAVAAGAAVQVADADAVLAEVSVLLADRARRARMHDAALAFHAGHRGAAQRLWTWLGPQLPRSVPVEDSGPYRSGAG